MKQLNIQSKPIKTKGYLLPWDKKTEQPLFIKIEDVLFIAVFSTKEKLDIHMSLMDYKDVEITTKMITNTDEFLDSIKPNRVALDPYNTEYFTTRFTELKTK